MSGLKTTETFFESALPPVRSAVRYLELLLKDGVVFQGPVTVESDGVLVLAQAGSLRSVSAKAKISVQVSMQKVTSQIQCLPFWKSSTPSRPAP